MKILYIIPDDISRPNGVLEKIISQITQWKSSDCVADVQTVVFGKKISEELTDVAVVHKCKSGIFNKYNMIGTLLQSYKPDLIYSRYFMFRPYLLYLISNASSKFIVEINGKDNDEIFRRFIATKKLTTLFAYIYNKLTRGVFFHMVSGVVSVAYDLVNVACNVENIIVIPNAIPDSYLKLGDLTPTSYESKKKRPILLFMSKKGKPWVGYEKILQIATNLRNCDIHIIGLSAVEFSDEVRELSLPTNMIFHGYIESPEKRESLMRMADVAISSLSLYLYGLTEASPLKTREYFAYGLPVIVSYRDTAIQDIKTRDRNILSEAILNIGSDENNVLDNIDKITAFVAKWTNSRDKKTAIREAVIKHMSYSSTEQKRLSFFKKVCGCEC